MRDEERYGGIHPSSLIPHPSSFPRDGTSARLTRLTVKAAKEGTILW
jgi:hypothetical protein